MYFFCFGAGAYTVSFIFLCCMPWVAVFLRLSHSIILPNERVNWRLRHLNTSRGSNIISILNLTPSLFAPFCEIIEKCGIIASEICGDYVPFMLDGLGYKHLFSIQGREMTPLLPLRDTSPAGNITIGLSPAIALSISFSAWRLCRPCLFIGGNTPRSGSMAIRRSLTRNVYFL